MAKTNRLLEMMRNKVPGIAIRTTLILGYPGETKEDFELVKEWVQTQRFDRLGVFTYSHEENTHAYNLEDDVPDAIKKQRADDVMALQSDISRELNQQKVGKTYKVLIDRKDGDWFIGRTEFDSPDVDNEVYIDATAHYLRIGDFVDVVIDSAEEYDLFATPLYAE